MTIYFHNGTLPSNHHELHEKRAVCVSSPPPLLHLSHFSPSQKVVFSLFSWDLFVGDCRECESGRGGGVKVKEMIFPTFSQLYFPLSLSSSSAACMGTTIGILGLPCLCVGMEFIRYNLILLLRACTETSRVVAVNMQTSSYVRKNLVETRVKGGETRWKCQPGLRDESIIANN